MQSLYVSLSETIPHMKMSGFSSNNIKSLEVTTPVLFIRKKRWTNWKKMIFYTHQRSEIARQTITLETDGKKTARALFHAGEVHSFHFSPASLPVSPEDGGVGRNKHWRNSCEAPSKRQRLTKRLWFNHRIMECFCSPTLYHHTNRLQHSGL